MIFDEEETNTKKEFVEMTVNLEPSEAKELRELGLKLIIDDEQELINYAINYLLRQSIKEKEKELENGSKS